MSKAKQHIRDTELRYKQGLGQNFIYDESLLEQLAEVSGAGEEDGVLEIGPGCGTLTGCLAPRVRQLIALEIDERLIPLLHGYLDKYENVTIVQGDVLKTNLHELTKPLGERFKVVANIPYYITTPLILLLLDSGLPIDSLALMVQKEVAEKMLAQPGDEGYGMLAVKCQYYGEPEIALDVPAAMFNPPPKVDSAFVVMPIRKEKPVQVEDEKKFFRVAQAAFAMRRKTMANNLMSAFGISKEKAASVLTACGLDERVRGEKLDMDAFARIANQL